MRGLIWIDVGWKRTVQILYPNSLGCFLRINIMHISFEAFSIIHSRFQPRAVADRLGILSAMKPCQPDCQLPGQHTRFEGECSNFDT